MACTAFAPAPRAMSSIISSSIRWSLTGGESDWTMNTSRDRTLAPSWIYRLSLLNLETPTSSSGTPRSCAMSAASGRLELPEKKRTSPASMASVMVGSRYQNSGMQRHLRPEASLSDCPRGLPCYTAPRRPPDIFQGACHGLTSAAARPGDERPVTAATACPGAATTGDVGRGGGPPAAGAPQAL